MMNLHCIRSVITPRESLSHINWMRAPHIVAPCLLFSLWNHSFTTYLQFSCLQFLSFGDVFDVEGKTEFLLARKTFIYGALCNGKSIE
jgi:hypothetical protein